MLDPAVQCKYIIIENTDYGNDFNNYHSQVSRIDPESSRRGVQIFMYKIFVL